MRPFEQRRLSTPCSQNSARVLSSFAREACAGLMPDEQSAMVELAVSEAVSNVVAHAYRDSEGWPVELSARLLPNRLEFLLADGGLPFDPTRVDDEQSFDWKSVDEVPESGRGLFLMRSVMDEVRFLNSGELNLCLMSKKLGPLPKEDGSASSERSPLLCDCADPFVLAGPEGAVGLMARGSSAKDSSPAPSLARAIPEITGALSLQTEPELAMNKLAEAMRVSFNAAGCALRLKRQGVLELAGRAGDVGPEPGPVALDSAELESQAAALCYEAASSFGPEGFRLCVPLTGIGRLLGVATLFFASKAELEAAKLSSRSELSNIVSVAIENQTLYSKALDAERAKKEMETAANLHKGVVSMLIPSMPGLSIYAKSQSALELGGDYMSFHKPSEQVLWFMICDAMGKGMSASFFSILAHMTFQSVLYMRDGIDPGALLTLGNKILARDFDRFEMFMTALVGKIDLAKGELTYSSAGHCPPIIYHPKAGTSLLDTQDFMLGVDPDTEYQTLSAPFKKSMRLIAYSDGLTDIVGPDGEMIGVEPLLDSCEEKFAKLNVFKSCEAIFNDAVAASGGRLQDDMTLIGIERV